MKTKIKKILLTWALIVPLFFTGSSYATSKIVYPLSEISELECRFQKFSELSNSCKRSLPILKSKDYEKYATQNGGYNDYTRIYTVLWGASYKYGWDVWNGGHLGVDIATAEGTPVYAIADGTVIEAGNMLSRGNNVSIEHTINGKTIISNYAHFSKIHVKEWQKVSAGDKIGEVGSTGNSTGNHLHFQIDLKSKYHPYYYDYEACPYSYYEISESDICYKELASHTIDPLVFLETSWAILDSIKIETKQVSQEEANKSLTTYKTSLSSWESGISSFDDGIFSRTVYVGYSESDIKLVQQIFKNLGYYDGAISGNYNDVLEDVIRYQLDTKVIASRSEVGAGYFWPKTRAQVKEDYKSYLAGDIKANTEEDVIVSSFESTTKKISQTKLLTREEIEAREVKDFLRDYNIDFDLNSVWGNVAVDETITIKLSITDKKGRAFRGNTPWELNFIVDRDKVQVFPNKLYYFTDGKRDIKITGLKAGNTKLYIRIGETNIKSFDIKVYDKNAKIYGQDGLILSNSKTVLWEQKTGILVMQDANKKNLINLKYYWNYTLEWQGDIQFCLKTGNLNNIKTVYKTPCDADDFVDKIEFSYEDTVWGLLLFDYKILSDSAKLSFINPYNDALFATKTIRTTAPKWLAKNYEYYEDIISVLENGIVDELNKWYFLEERQLIEWDAIDWIRNTLVMMKNNTWDPLIRKQIDHSLYLISEENPSRFNSITRKEFLEKVYSYLVFDKNAEINISYRDLDDDTNKKANTIFDENTTWKDRFGQSYYRPERNLTRGEWAYLISAVLEKSKKSFLTLK